MQDNSRTGDPRKAPTRRSLGRPLLLGVGVVSVTLFAGLLIDRGLRAPNPSATQSGRQSEAPTTAPTEPTGNDGPTVWYSILGNERLALYQRRLDGRSAPNELAWRPSDTEGRSSFIVGPAGSPILFAQRASRGWTIEPVASAGSPNEPAWTVDVRHADTDFSTGVWSPDGRYWAGYASARNNSRYAVVIEARAGLVWELPLRPGQWVQGFEGLGPRLVLRDEGPQPGAGPESTTMRIVDPAVGMPGIIASSPVDTPPHSSHSSDFAPRTGLWAAEDYERGQLVVGDIQTGERRYLDYPGQRYGWVGFVPQGDRVLAVVDAGEDACGARRSAMRLVDLNGDSRAIWEGSASPNEFALAPEGDFVGFDAWIEYVGGTMVVVDIVSGRSTELPMPEGSYLGEVLAIQGGVRLPDPAVPPAESDFGTPPYSTADVVAAGPRLVTGSVDYDSTTCTATVNVRLLAPAIDGGLAVIDELPPAVFPDVERTDVGVDVAPRPGTSTVLVSYGDRRNQEQFLWTPLPGRPPGTDPVTEPLRLPPDWPDDRSPGRWRPDGDALGLGSTRARTFLWFEVDEQVTRRIRVGPDDSWNQVIGWTADGSAIVIERNGCIDYCDVERHWVGVMRLSDGTVRDVTPDTPIEAIGTGTANVSVRTGLAAWSVGANRITLTVGIGLPGDFTFRLPGRLRDLDGRTQIWSRDGGNLYLVAKTTTGRVLVRIKDPRPGAPLRPRVVGQLPAGAEVDEVEIAGSWVRVSVSRLGSCSEGLVNLRTGEAYLEPRCVMSEAWLPEH